MKHIGSTLALCVFTFVLLCGVLKDTEAGELSVDVRKHKRRQVKFTLPFIKTKKCIQNS